MGNRHKFLFIRIPKTGSTSIGEVLKTPKGHQTLAYFQERNINYSYSFAFVRNTYNRLVSWYRHEYGNGVTSFRKWVDDGCPVAWGNDWHADWQENNPMNQMSYIKNKDGNIGVDFIGRFENIENDYLQVCSNLGIDPPPKLPKIVPSPFHKKKQNTFTYNAFDYYDLETREKVDELFSEEIEYFNFKFFDE